MTRIPADTHSDTAGTRDLKIAVVQPALRLAEEDWNLRRIEALVRDAVREHNPAIVVLPEAYNTPNVYHSCLRRTPVPIDGAPISCSSGWRASTGVGSVVGMSPCAARSPATVM